MRLFVKIFWNLINYLKELEIILFRVVPINFVELISEMIRIHSAPASKCSKCTFRLIDNESIMNTIGEGIFLFFESGLEK